MTGVLGLSMVHTMLIGLTGGIACGKTTVVGMLRGHGAFCVDADQVARDVVDIGTPGLNAIVDTFGDWVIGPDGQLDRGRVGQHVFEDTEARKTLESIIHPMIARESTQQIQQALSDGWPLVVYDAALLFESGRADVFRPIVVVFVTPEVQEARLMLRDDLSRQAAQQRVAAQMPLHEKVRRADHIINNSGTLDDTRVQVAALWKELTGGT